MSWYRRGKSVPQDLRVEVARPCPAKWSRMEGDERVRFCSQCQLNVYNLSGMTADEGKRLIQEAEGRICVRYLMRRDGTVLTRDCGFVALTRWRLRAALAAVLGVLGIGCTPMAKAGAARSVEAEFSRARRNLIDINMNLREKMPEADRRELEAIRDRERHRLRDCAEGIMKKPNTKIYFWF